MSLKAFVNVQGTPTAERVATAAVVVDLEISTDNADPPGDWSAAEAAIESGNGAILRGTYASSRLALNPGDRAFYYAEAVDLGDYSAGQYWPHDPGDRPEGKYLDYTQPATLTQLVGDLAQFAADRGQDILYLDNVVHPDSVGGEGTGIVPTWSQTMALAAAVKTSVNPVKVYLNIAWAIGAVAVNPADITALAASCHGITLETGLYSGVGSDATKLADAVSAYQTMIADGIDIVFIPALSYPSAEYEAEARFLAGFAMVLWGPRVVYPWFADDAVWGPWDETYGAPTGAIVQSGTTLSRDFGNWTFTVDSVARSVLIGLSDMAQATDIRNVIADRLWGLFEAQATITAAVLPGARNKGDEQGWLRQTINKMPAAKRNMEISFTRGNNSLGEANTTLDDYRRVHEVLIVYREPLPSDPGVHPIQEAIEQTLLLAGQDLGLTIVESRGPLVCSIRLAREGEYPNPGRVTEFRLAVTTTQSVTAQRALTA